MCKVLAISALLVGCFIPFLNAGKLYYPEIIESNPAEINYQHPSGFNNPPVYNVQAYTPIIYPAKKTEEWIPVDSIPFAIGDDNSLQVNPCYYHLNHKPIDSVNLFPHQEHTTERQFITPKVISTPAPAAGSAIVPTESPAAYPAVEVKHDVLTTLFPTTPSAPSKEGELRHHHDEDHHYHHKHKHNHLHHHHHHKQSVPNTDTKAADAVTDEQMQFGKLNIFLKNIEHKIRELKFAVFAYARLLDEDSDLQDLDRSLQLSELDKDYSGIALEASTQNDTLTSDGGT